MYKYDDEIRRTDLALRCGYPELETVIYKIGPFQYVIHCTDFQGDFMALSKEFNDEIRPIAAPVVLSQTEPAEFEIKLPPVLLDNPVDGFRASVSTEPEVRNLVEARFPDMEIISIVHHPGSDYSVDIMVSHDTSCESVKEMQDFLLMVLGTDAIHIVKSDAAATINRVQEDMSKNASDSILENTQENTSEHTDKKPEKNGRADMAEVLLKMLETRQLSFHKELSFSAPEADYWFSNAEAIYQNRIKRSEIPFYRAKQKNCFMDCSVYNHMDIRKALFLYETVYIGMPVEKHLDTFLQSQRMTGKELVELIDMGKVVLVLTNTERRYDKKLLNEAYGTNPLGVIGRRGVNVLVASYLSELEKRYVKNYPGIYETARDVYREARSTGNRQLLQLADSMSFPLRAKAQSFGYLNTDGLLSLSAYGVNTILQDTLGEQLDRDKKDMLDLCMSAWAGSIHLSMALNAAYFPFKEQNPLDRRIVSDFYTADIMEHMLSFYWYNDGQSAVIQQSRNMEGLEQLELFECEKSLSAVDVARSADEWNTPMLFGEILKGIAKLPLEQQNEKIREYNHLLLEVSKQSDRSSVTDLIMTGIGFVPVNDTVSFLADTFDLLRNMVADRKPIKEYREKRNLKWKMEQAEKREIDQQAVDDVYVLDKVYRVARLQQRESSVK